MHKLILIYKEVYFIFFFFFGLKDYEEIILNRPFK